MVRKMKPKKEKGHVAGRFLLKEIERGRLMATRGNIVRRSLKNHCTGRETLASLGEEREPATL